MSDPAVSFATFKVAGKPIPKGSMRASLDKYGDIKVYSDNRELTGWTRSVYWSAKAAMGRRSATTHPVEVVIDFVVPVPKRREGELWPKQRGTGDLDKLTRAILDGITGPVLVDDSQVVRILATKRYENSRALRSTGVTVWVYEIPPI